MLGDRLADVGVARFVPVAFYAYVLESNIIYGWVILRDNWRLFLDKFVFSIKLTGNIL